jgi:RimJ/RimL family protein N-acetyltransferase
VPSVPDLTLPLEPDYPVLTDRLLLRPYRPDDLDAVLDLFGRADVSRYLLWEPMDLEAATALLRRRLTTNRIAKEGDGILLVVTEQATDRFVGEVMLQLTSAASRQGEIGWSIHPDMQGRGYATEAAREMLRLGFESLGLHRIMADSDPRNAASIKVMEKLGMRLEAHHVDSMFLKGEWVGAVVGAMLESEWRSR